jgi:hypothetical protein
VHLKRKAAHASDEAKAIGRRAQKRLCGRYRTLIQAGKNTKLVALSKKDIRIRSESDSSRILVVVLVDGDELSLKIDPKIYINHRYSNLL